MSRYDDDGKAYIAYFRADYTTGFIWSGVSIDPVQVTREMGEPVIDTFMFQSDQRQHTAVVLAQFQEACDRYLVAAILDQRKGKGIFGRRS